MSNLENLEAKLADLRNQVKEAEREVNRERDLVKKSITPIYRFTLAPAEHRTHHEILDDAIVLVRLEGVVENAEAMREVGADPFQGGMTYFFNKLSGKIVTSEGGGNIWLSTDASFSRSTEEREDARKTFDVLSKFLVENPEGGDVTEIVMSHRRKFKQ